MLYLVGIFLVVIGIIFVYFSNEKSVNKQENIEKDNTENIIEDNKETKEPDKTSQMYNKHLFHDYEFGPDGRS